jgi:hypothetical protein
MRRKASLDQEWRVAKALQLEIIFANIVRHLVFGVALGLLYKAGEA